MENYAENEAVNAPVESFDQAAVATAQVNDVSAAAAPAEANQTGEQISGYDADSIQRQAFTVEEDGEEYETAHIFAPLSDERYFEYDRAAKTVITGGGGAVSTRNLEAATELFDDLILRVEGFDGELPGDWKELIDPVGEKLPSINRLLVCVVADEPEKSLPTKSMNIRTWNKKASEIILEFYFNGEETRGKHFLRAKTVEDAKAFEKLNEITIKRSGHGLASSSDIVLPSLAEGKAKLYDRMKAKPAEGYAGRVPAHHKVAVVDSVFRSTISAARERKQN